MKLWAITKYFLIILAVVILNAQTACAQNPFKLDISKTAGKISDGIQKIQENFQTTMEQISESQFATFIGNGIKAAKDGINYAKETYQKVVETYQGVKDAVVNSKEYEIAMLSKKIAEESKVLSDLQKEKASRLAELEESKELERITLEEKVIQAQDNFQVRVDIYQGEMQKAETDTEKAAIQEEMISFQSANDAEMASLNQEIAALESTLEEENQLIEDEFSVKLYEQGEKIAELTLELQELVSESSADSGGSSSFDPLQETTKAMDELSFKEGAVVSLKDRKEKERVRKSRKKSVVLDSSSSTVTQIASIQNTQNEQENTSDTSETVNGKSEAVQTAVQNTVFQMEALHRYLVMEVENLKAQTLLILANSEIRTGEPKTVIDICDYEDKGGSTNLADLVQKGKDTLSDVQDKVEDVKDVGEDIGDTADAIKGAGEDVNGALGMMGIM